MAYPEKVVVAIDTSQSFEGLESIRKMDWLNEAQFSFVHVFKLLSYGDGLSFNVAFPIQENQEELTEAVVAKMKSVAPQILPFGHIGKITFKCLFDEDPKEKLNIYLEEHKIDLLIISNRKNRGLFESSFSNYFCLHAPCSVLVMRSEK
jgi:nucleotide-binding universal stress UspA family protein